MTWTWELCDTSQTVLATLTNRKPGASVHLVRNQAREAQVKLAADDPAVPLATAGNTVLRVKVPGWTDPLFVGKVTTPNTVVGEGASNDVTIDAVGPLFHLQQAIARRYLGFSLDVDPATLGSLQMWGGLSYATYQADILWDLISNYGNAPEIARGAVPARPPDFNRTISYPLGKNIWEAIIEMTGFWDGPDIAESPKQLGTGVLANFDTFVPRQGSDKTATVLFDYAWNNETATAFSYAPQGADICNSFVALDGGHPDDSTFHVAVRAYHPASITAYGLHEQYALLTEVPFGNDSWLASHAKGVVNANAFPTPFFDFTPRVAPIIGKPDAPVLAQSGGDYWLADDITIRAHLDYHAPGAHLDLSGQVQEITFTEEDNGDVIPDLVCAPLVPVTGAHSSDVSLFTFYAQTET